MNFEQLTQSGSSLAFYADAPLWEGQSCGAIGQFDFKSVEDGLVLIKHAVNRAKGLYALFGPMNGDTWHSYRVVSETSDRAPFPMEPISGPHDLTVLEQAGFKSISCYASTIGTLDEAIGPAPITIADVSLKIWDGRGGKALVDQIYAMSAQGFAKNKFFKPLDLDGFREIYYPLIDSLDPRFVLLAEHKSGQTCGFAFGYPADAETIVLKTYASGIRGVGHALADGFHRAARDAGFSKIIHGLMHADNISLNHSAKHGLSVFRRYDLMALKL